MNPIRPRILQAALTVTRTQFITPHYIRVYLTGKELAQFANTTPGVNNKILVPPKGVPTIHFPQIDPQTRQWAPMAEAIRPTMRTYTHRGLDLTANELWIDFVAHGEEGPASAWAMGAQTGDVLGVLMKEGKMALYPQAEQYVLVGDATAIPVLGAILEDLPASARGICILEVAGQADEQALATAAQIEFIWLHNGSPHSGSELAEVVRQQALPEGSRFGYVAAESSSVKAIRTYLRQERGWQPAELEAYAYWKAGVSEDKSEAVRRQEMT